MEKANPENNPSDRLTMLAKESSEYKKQKRFSECIREMDRYAREENDPKVRTVLLTAQATCAMELGDLSAADAAISKIDRVSLIPAESIYVNPVLASILQEEGRLVEAEAILSASLRVPEVRRQEHREALYEMLARKGFILAHLNQCETALKLFEESLATLENGDLDEGIRLYQGYCLQTLGRLDEAEKCLRKAINGGLQDLAADAFYRLGLVLSQKKNYDAAIVAFRNAEQALPRGQTSLTDILMALSETSREIGQIEVAEQYRTRASSAPTVQ